MRIISGRHGTVGERRSAFTLIEMLIVISLILILVGLLAAAVIKVISKGAEAQVQSEFQGLANAIGAFKQDFNTTYIPSRLLLCEDGQWSLYNGTPFQQLATDSLNYLQQIFGSRAPLANTPSTAAAFAAAWPMGGIDWNQDGSIYPTVNAGQLNAPIILEGQHCIVFFLGGVPLPKNSTQFGSNGTCLGFQASPTNPWPATLGGFSGTTKGPYYDFKPNRLFLDNRPIPNSNPSINLNFFVYLDPFNKVTPQPGDPNGPTVSGWTNTVYPKQPYAFFSAYRSQNGYNRYGATDCPSLAYGQGSASVAPPLLFPYKANTSVFLNPSSYQILSAGADGVWGQAPTATTSFTGGIWAGATGSGVPNLDDWGNFSRVFLGAPQSN